MSSRPRAIPSEGRYRLPRERACHMRTRRKTPKGPSQSAAHVSLCKSTTNVVVIITNYLVLLLSASSEALVRHPWGGAEPAVFIRDETLGGAAQKGDSIAR